MTLRRFCVVGQAVALVFCLLGTSPRAAAQSPERAGPAQLASPHPDDARLTTARAHIARGEHLFDAGDYRGALAEFQRAYELSAGHAARPALLYNLALCHERLFAYTQAVTLYERYLREAGAQAEDRASVESALRTLRGLLATVVLRIRFEQNRPGAEVEVWLDQQKVEAQSTTLLVPSGRHRIEVRAPGYEPAVREVQLAARERTELAIELEPLSRGLSPPLFWTSASLMGASAVVSGVLGARALSLKRELLDRPPVLRTESDQRELTRRVLATDVMLGATGLFAVTTVLLYFLTDFESSERERATRQARVRFAPGPGLGLAVLGELP